MAENSIADSAEVRRARFRVIGLFGGFKVSQAIYCAVALKLPDVLERGAQPLDAIAEACGCEASRLERLLAALCTVGIVSRSGERYAPTPLSSCLCADAPGNLVPMILFQGNELYRAYSHLLPALKTGAVGWEEAFGCNLWEYLEQHPDRSALFDRTMADGPADDLATISAIANGTRHVIDIGGGNGWLIRRVLEYQQGWTGALFDRPEVIDRARRDPAVRSLGDRCSFVGGDFFREVPSGADLYLMRHVLHDWSDEDCIRILSCCHRAMSPSAKLIVLEGLMGADVAKGLAEWSNLSMLLIGGAERTLARYEELLSASGFSTAPATEAGPGLFAIEARRAG